MRNYLKAINTCSFTDCSTIELSKKVWQPENWKSVKEPIHSLVWFVHPDFWIDKKNQTLKIQTIEHSGNQAGFKAHLILIPEKRITVIWLTNNDKFISETIRKFLLELKYIE